MSAMVAVRRSNVRGFDSVGACVCAADELRRTGSVAATNMTQACRIGVNMKQELSCNPAHQNHQNVNGGRGNMETLPGFDPHGFLNDSGGSVGSGTGGRR